MSSLEISFRAMRLDEAHNKKMSRQNIKSRHFPNLQSSLEFTLKRFQNTAITARKNFVRAAIRGEKKLNLIYSSRLKSLKSGMVEKRVKRFDAVRPQEYTTTGWSSFQEGYFAEENREVVRIEGDRSRSRHRLNEQWRKLRKKKNFDSEDGVSSTGSRRDKMLRSLVKELEKYEMHDIAKELLMLSEIKEKAEREYLKEMIKVKRITLQASKGAGFLDRGDQGIDQVMTKREKRYMLELPRLQKTKNTKTTKRRSEKARGKTPQERVTALLSYQHPDPLWKQIQETAYSGNVTRPFTFSYFPRLPNQKLTGKYFGLDARRGRRARAVRKKTKKN